MKEVIVVSSASTDGTDGTVKELEKEFPALRLISQPERTGKNSAVNAFLDAKTTEIVAIVNADNVLKGTGSLRKLIEPFSDPSVGMAGGHPIPLNGTDTLAGYASNLIWSLHHHIAMESPKIGELVAYRDVGTRLPPDLQSDEDLIREGVEAKGYRVVYAPGAETYIRGPETVRDLLKQRVRVNIGQSYMVRNDRYYNPARDPKVLMSVFTDTVKELGFHPVRLLISVMLETYCRLYGRLYADSGKGDDSVWDPVESTKKL